MPADLTIKGTSSIRNLAEFKAKHGLGYQDLMYILNKPLNEVRELSKEDQNDADLTYLLQTIDTVLDRYKTNQDIFTGIDAQQAGKAISNLQKENERLRATIRKLTQLFAS